METSVSSSVVNFVGLYSLEFIAWSP
uniref:Uncharacterized protein n=1 Tax=Rhizophora mucronata TaxID=61149 RepID=A0A2P2P5A1_RHIMU